MLNHGDTSKVELAKQLSLSMPTVLSNVNELMETGLIPGREIPTPSIFSESTCVSHIFFSSSASFV